MATRRAQSSDHVQNSAHTNVKQLLTMQQNALRQVTYSHTKDDDMGRCLLKEKRTTSRARHKQVVEQLPMTRRAQDGRAMGLGAVCALAL